MILTTYLAETRVELIKLVRLPAFAIPSLAFPVVFYIFFAVILQQHDQAAAARYLLGSYGAFGTIGAALFGSASVSRWNAAKAGSR